MKYILLILLSYQCYSQTWQETPVHTASSRCKIIRFEDIPVGGTLDIFELLGGTAIERIYVVTDSVLQNVTEFSLSTGDHDLMICDSTEFFKGADPSEYEAWLQSGKVYYIPNDYTIRISYRSFGGTVTGKIRVYLITRELF